jgi:hypothetical protein
MIIGLSKGAVLHRVGSILVCFLVFKDPLYLQKLLLCLEKSINYMKFYCVLHKVESNINRLYRISLILC